VREGQGKRQQPNFHHPVSLPLPAFHTCRTLSGIIAACQVG
jgi:hypothetical protein